MKTFGEKLRQARNRLGISQEAAARKLDVALVTWARWERNQQHPSVDILPRIAEVVNVKPGDLL